MGTPEFAVPALERLLEAGYPVAAVYTQPDTPAGRGRALSPSPVKKLALAKGLTVMQPVSLKPAEEVERLRSFAPEAIVVAAYGQLLSPSVLSIPPKGCLNVHPSLLPRYRGPSPVSAALLAGDTETGVSIMLLDAGMDTGPILAQEKVAISPQDTTGSLLARLAQAGAELLVDTLGHWLKGEIVPKPQEEALASYSRLLTKEEGEIDWHKPARELWLRVRAFTPWPGCYTSWEGKRLKILEAAPLAQEGVGVGRVVAIPPRSGAVVGVGTGKEVLGLLQLQIEGKKAMSAEEFLRGQRTFLGALLPS